LQGGIANLSLKGDRIGIKGENFQLPQFCHIVNKF
jgi:hypothetical protein